MAAGHWRPRAFVIDDMVLVRLKGILTQAELRLADTSNLGNGRELIKRVRIALLEQGRPLLESAIEAIAGVKVKSLHTDISTRTGERIIVFTLASAPRISGVPFQIGGPFNRIFSYRWNGGCYRMSF